MHYHVAYAIKGGKILAVGENGFKGRGLSLSKCTTHAEVDCLNKINQKNRKISKITICSILHENDYKNSKPCANCCMSMIRFGIKKIKYFDGNSWIVSKIDDIKKDAITSSGDRFMVK